MDGDQSKRKSSQEHPESVKNPKIRRINSSQTLPANRIQNKTVENLVSFWTAGGNVHPLLTQEGVENAKLQEAEQKLKEAGSIVHDLQKKLFASEGNVANLNIALKQEATEKQTLVAKMNSIWEFIKTITEHVTYATDRLDECQKQVTYLNTVYNDVILKLRGDNETLNKKLNKIADVRNSTAEEALEQLSSKKAELEELKINCKHLEYTIASEREIAKDAMNELEKIKQKIFIYENSEIKLKEKIQQLENDILNEREKISEIRESEQQRWSQSRHEYEGDLARLKSELDDTKEELRNVKIEKEEAFQMLGGKEKDIEQLQQKVENYTNKIEKLQSYMNDTSTNLEQFNNEKNDWEFQLQEKNKEICKMLEDLNSVTAEKKNLENQMTVLNEKLNIEEKKKSDLQAVLSQNRDELRESNNRVNELNKILEKHEKFKKEMEIEMSKKDSKILELDKKINRLEEEHLQKIHQQTLKYDKCTSDLKKLTSTLKTTEKKFSKISEDHEKLKKKNLESYEQLKLTEESLAKKTDEHSELMEKFNKLQANSKANEKKGKENYLTAAKEIEQKILLLEDQIKPTTPISTPKIKTRSSAAKLSEQVVTSVTSPTSSVKSLSSRTVKSNAVITSPTSSVKSIPARSITPPSSPIIDFKAKSPHPTTPDPKRKSRPQIRSIETPSAAVTKPILKTFNQTVSQTRGAKSPKKVNFDSKKRYSTFSDTEQKKLFHSSDEEDDFDRIINACSQGNVSRSSQNSQPMPTTPTRKFFKTSRFSDFD